MFCVFEINCFCTAVAISDLMHDVNYIFSFPELLTASENRF